MLQGHPYKVFNTVPLTHYRTPDNADMYLVNTLSEWEDVFPYLYSLQSVAVDTESTGFEYFKGDYITGFSMGWGNSHFYIPVRHKDSLTGGAQPAQLDINDIMDDLRSFFSRKDIITVFHHAKHDLHFLNKENIKVDTKVIDTLPFWKFYDEEAPGALKTICAGWTDIYAVKHKGVVGKWANEEKKFIDKWRDEEAKARRQNYRDWLKEEVTERRSDLTYQAYKVPEIKKIVEAELGVHHKYYKASKESVDYGFLPIENMFKYAALDTYLTYKLYKFLLEKKFLTKKTVELLVNEQKLSNCLYLMEEAGMLVSRDYLIQLKGELERELVELELLIREEAFQTLRNCDIVNANKISDEEIEKFTSSFKVSSAPALSDILYCAGFKPLGRTDKGDWKMDSGILEKYSAMHTLPSLVLSYRKKSKLLGTYVDSILEKITDDNILHCSFNQNVSTGRMSASDPNLMNIPGKDDRIRQAFICPEDYVYVLADYSQVEVRLTAHFSQDAILREAYLTGKDVHTATASKMFSVPYDELNEVIKKEDKNDSRYTEYARFRKIAKQINFSIIYGVSSMGLAEQIERPAEFIDRDEAWQKKCEDFIETYFRTHTGVDRFLKDTHKAVKKYKQIESYFGRVRHLPHVDYYFTREDGSRGSYRSRACRQGANALVQGTAADVFKIAVVRIVELLKGTKSKLVNVVHDEVQLYVHKTELHLVNKIKYLMEDFDFSVPLKAEFSYTTTSWADKKSL